MGQETTLNYTTQITSPPPAQGTLYDPKDSNHQKYATFKFTAVVTDDRHIRLTATLQASYGVSSWCLRGTNQGEPLTISLSDETGTGLTATAVLMVYYTGYDGRPSTSHYAEANIEIGYSRTSFETTKYTFELQYNVQGGNDAPSTQNGESSNPTYDFTISAHTPVKTNMVFQGWSKIAGNTSNLYLPGDKITVSYEAPQILYAIWAPKEPPVDSCYYGSVKTGLGWKDADSISVKTDSGWIEGSRLYIKINGAWIPVGIEPMNISVAVKDASGNIISGATIAIEYLGIDSNWNLAGIYFSESA